MYNLDDQIICIQECKNSHCFEETGRKRKLEGKTIRFFLRIQITKNREPRKAGFRFFAFLQFQMNLRKAVVSISDKKDFLTRVKNKWIFNPERLSSCFAALTNFFAFLENLIANQLDFLKL